MSDSPLSEETHAKHENEKKKEGSGGEGEREGEINKYKQKSRQFILLRFLGLTLLLLLLTSKKGIASMTRQQLKQLQQPISFMESLPRSPPSPFFFFPPPFFFFEDFMLLAVPISVCSFSHKFHQRVRVEKANHGAVPDRRFALLTHRQHPEVRSKPR